MQPVIRKEWLVVAGLIFGSVLAWDCYENGWKSMLGTCALILAGKHDARPIEDVIGLFCSLPGFALMCLFCAYGVCVPIRALVLRVIGEPDAPLVADYDEPSDANA